MESKEYQELVTRVYQKYVDIFTEVLQNKNIDEAIAMVKLYPKLPEVKQQEFDDDCFSNRLPDLLNCLTETSEKGVEFLKLWFPRALEFWMRCEFLFSIDPKFEIGLNRKIISADFERELEIHGINAHPAHCEYALLGIPVTESERRIEAAFGETRGRYASWKDDDEPMKVNAYKRIVAAGAALYNPGNQRQEIIQEHRDALVTFVQSLLETQIPQDVTEISRNFYDSMIRVAMAENGPFHLDEALAKQVIREALEKCGISIGRGFTPSLPDFPKIIEPFATGWLLTDKDGKTYHVKKEKNVLNIYHYDTTVHKQRLCETLQFLIDKSLEEYYGSILLPIFQQEIESGRILGTATELLTLLCKFVDRTSRIKDGAVIYEQGLLPFAQTSGDGEILKAVIKGIARIIERRGGERQLSEKVGQFLGNTPSALDIVKELYPDDAKNMLFRWYQRLWEQRGDSIPSETELVDLYKNERYELFLEHFRWGINQTPINPGKIANFVIDLIPLLQPVQDRFYNEPYFQGMLEAVSSASKKQLPDKKFITELFEVFESMGADIPIAILGRQCVKSMDITAKFSELSEAEERAIAKWWESEPTEKELVAKMLVLRELQNLPRGYTPQQLSEEHLQNFQANKHALLATDFEVAVRKIYTVFAQSSHRWEPESWETVEEVARKNKDVTPSSELIQLFLEVCSRRRDYLDILASGTVRWMQNPKMFRFLRLLTDLYEDLDKKEKKEYEKLVDDSVKIEGEDEYPGFKIWEEKIGREKGLRRFLPFRG